MRPITVSSHRVEYHTPIKPVHGTPSAKAVETQIHTGTSVKTTATSVLPLTTTAHPQQTPPTRSLLSDTTQALKTAQAASALIGQTNESNQPHLTMTALIEATKPLFNLLQKVEHDVDVAYGKRDAIRSSAQDQKGANKSASAKTLDSFRQQRNELQRTGKTGDLSSTEAYKALKGNRPSSQFERLLPTDSQFRHLLDPFTGGIRDVQTGLYVELHVGEESGDLVMVFPGSGAADMGTKQWQTNLAQFSGKGGVPAMYAQAAELAKEIQTLQNSLSFDNHASRRITAGGPFIGRRYCELCRPKTRTTCNLLQRSRPRPRLPERSGPYSERQNRAANPHPLQGRYHQQQKDTVPTSGITHCRVASKYRDSSTRRRDL